MLHLPPALVGTLCEVGGDKSEGLGLRPDSEVWSKLFPFLDITFSLCDTRRLDRRFPWALRDLVAWGITRVSWKKRFLGILQDL